MKKALDEDAVDRITPSGRADRRRSAQGWRPLSSTGLDAAALSGTRERGRDHISYRVRPKEPRRSCERRSNVSLELAQFPGIGSLYYAGADR